MNGYIMRPEPRKVDSFKVNLQGREWRIWNDICDLKKRLAALVHQAKEEGTAPLVKGRALRSFEHSNASGEGGEVDGRTLYIFYPGWWVDEVGSLDLGDGALAEILIRDFPWVRALALPVDHDWDSFGNPNQAT